MKLCSKCNEMKHLDEFFKDKANLTDGRYSLCKKCKHASTYKWRAANREKYNKGQREQHAKNYQRNRLYRYKLTPDQYDKMVLDQNDTCAIPGCGKKSTEKRELAIDHHHGTKKVRGLLCYKCNRDMNVLDNPEHLAKLIEYRDKKRE